MRDFLAGVTEITGQEFPDDDLDEAIGRLGGIARIIGATLRDTANVTMFNAGYKANVVPSVATADRRRPHAAGDGRTPSSASCSRSSAPISPPSGTAFPRSQTTFDGALVDRMTAAIQAEDPGARTLPYMLSAGTDAKSFQQLGIRHFGFSPLKLPPELDFTALFHGVDERVPVEALTFGTRVLLRLLHDC